MHLMQQEAMVEEEVHLVKLILDSAHITTKMYTTILNFAIKSTDTLKFTKKSSVANAQTNSNSNDQIASDTTNSQVQVEPASVITQEKYNQLVCLLQQEKLDSARR